jgi:hypothetical protein
VYRCQEHRGHSRYWVSKAAQCSNCELRYSPAIALATIRSAGYDPLSHRLVPPGQKPESARPKSVNLMYITNSPVGSVHLTVGQGNPLGCPNSVGELPDSYFIGAISSRLSTGGTFLIKTMPLAHLSCRSVAETEAISAVLATDFHSHEDSCFP